jgi:hypothetical protein
MGFSQIPKGKGVEQRERREAHGGFAAKSFRLKASFGAKRVITLQFWIDSATAFVERRRPGVQERRVQSQESAGPCLCFGAHMKWVQQGWLSIFAYLPDDNE